MTPRPGPSVLLAASNGIGMGHLSRQLAVALAMADRARPALFSLSMGLPLATAEGVEGEYCPSVERGWFDPREWHGYLRDRLVAIVEELNSSAVVFDGVAPYPGILLAMRELPDTAFIWQRRGMWRRGVNEAQLRKSRLFDLVLEPGDLARRNDHGPTGARDDARVLGPISLTEVIQPLPRGEAAADLGLDPYRTTALMTLGTGRLGDVAGPGETAVGTLLAETDWQIAITTSALAHNVVTGMESERIVAVKGVYPLARYLSAFDAAVSSAGYNAVHELIPFAIPTVLVANVSTRTDDQAARSEYLERAGLALSSRDDDIESVRRAVETLARAGIRERLSAACAELDASEKTGGAAQAGGAVLDLIAAYGGRRESLPARLERMRDAVKEGVKGVLGVEGTERVKRWLGRAPSPSGRRMSVYRADGLDAQPKDDRRPLVFTDTVDVGRLLAEIPVVEHLLPGSSPGYHARRMDIARSYFDLLLPT